MIRPLFMELLDEKQTEFAKKRLIKALDQYGWRLGTGFLSTSLILYVLADLDIAFAYRLLENEELPGWLSMPKAGATTIWEAWEGPGSTSGGIGSLNHYSKGAVCEWLFTSMCGIQVAGENHFTIAPKPGGHFTYASARYDSIYGMVESKWEIAGDSHGSSGQKVVYTITVPANCTADVILPDGRTETVGPGRHVYES